MDEREVLTAREVARLLRISLAMVSRLASQCLLTHYRIGRAIRFPRSAVEEFRRRVLVEAVEGSDR